MRGSQRGRPRGGAKRLNAERLRIFGILPPISLLRPIKGLKQGNQATRRTGSAGSPRRHPWRTRQRPLAFPYPTLKNRIIGAWPPGARGIGQEPPSSSGAMRACTPSFCAERRITPPIPILPATPRRRQRRLKHGGLRPVRNGTYCRDFYGPCKGVGRTTGISEKSEAAQSTGGFFLLGRMLQGGV